MVSMDNYRYKNTKDAATVKMVQGKFWCEEIFGNILGVLPLAMVFQIFILNVRVIKYIIS